MALDEQNDRELDLAIGRIRLLHSMILAFGGIPLLYMGDEIGLLNDHSYRDNPNLAGDNRWMHRPFMDWEKVAERDDSLDVSGKLFQSIKQLIQVRKRSVCPSCRSSRICSVDKQ